MRKLVTYNKSQYKALIDQLGDGGFKLMSLLELHGSDQISELLSEKKLVVDVSSLVGLLSGDLQLASKFELLVHQLPFGTLFIGDDKTVNEGAYQLRTMFDDIIECDIEIDKDAQKDKRVKRTLVSLDELEFKQVLTTLESELIGQIEFKRSFESRSRSFRLFNALDEQPVFSLLLLGPSGVGKTEVAKILCEAIAPCQPLPKVNLGNYSSKDSLNSLIGSPRGYMGSEEGELGRRSTRPMPEFSWWMSSRKLNPPSGTSSSISSRQDRSRTPKGWITISAGSSSYSRQTAPSGRSMKLSRQNSSPASI